MTGGKKGASTMAPASSRRSRVSGSVVTAAVRPTPELPRPVGEARAEWKILRELAARTHPEGAHLLGAMVEEAA